MLAKKCEDEGCKPGLHARDFACGHPLSEPLEALAGEVLRGCHFADGRVKWRRHRATVDLPTLLVELSNRGAADWSGGEMVEEGVAEMLEELDICNRVGREQTMSSSQVT